MLIRKPQASSDTAATAVQHFFTNSTSRLSNVRRSSAVTFCAVEQRAKHLFPALFGKDPCSLRHGRVVTNVLEVPARELCNPMVFFVDVISDN